MCAGYFVHGKNDIVCAEQFSESLKQFKNVSVFGGGSIQRSLSKSIELIHIMGLRASIMIELCRFAASARLLHHLDFDQVQITCPECTILAKEHHSVSAMIFVSAC